MEDNPQSVQQSPLLMAMMRQMAMQKPQQSAGGVMGGLSSLLSSPGMMQALKTYMGGLGGGYSGPMASPNLVNNLPNIFTPPSQ